MCTDLQNKVLEKKQTNTHAKMRLCIRHRSLFDTQQLTPSHNNISTHHTRRQHRTTLIYQFITDCIYILLFLSNQPPLNTTNQHSPFHTHTHTHTAVAVTTCSSGAASMGRSYIHSHSIRSNLAGKDEKQSECVSTQLIKTGK